MTSDGARPGIRIGLLAPVIVLVLAATAVPIQLRPLGQVSVSVVSSDIPDILANVLGYLPVGIVLGGAGILRGTAIAGAISLFAETGQLVMRHRDPSLVDVLANVTGALLGAWASRRWRIRSPAIRITPAAAVLATLLLVAPVWYLQYATGSPVSPRGRSEPGMLEGHWTLEGRTVLDLGRTTALRLAGSMTIAAWIDASAHPVDDAAIVSQLGRDSGYQLDTTIDKGPRTIGFKLSDVCGRLMARYGATPLALHTWYHVAGVYDAAARTLDVYLNGRLDNGPLVGSVGSAQRSSRDTTYIGRRPRLRTYDFAGTIDDVRIYSFALTADQVGAVMRGEPVAAPAAWVRPPDDHSCPPLSDLSDKDLPAIAGVCGVLVAVACLGGWPAAPRILPLAASLAAGGLLLTLTAPDLPAGAEWAAWLTALAAGASVVASVRRNG